MSALDIEVLKAAGYAGNANCQTVVTEHKYIVTKRPVWDDEPSSSTIDSWATSNAPTPDPTQPFPTTHSIWGRLRTKESSIPYTHILLSTQPSTVHTRSSPYQRADGKWVVRFRWTFKMVYTYGEHNPGGP